jgi:hypothetical protein
MAKTNSQSNADVTAEILSAAVDMPEGFTEVQFKNPLANEGDTVCGEYLDAFPKTVGGKPINCYRVKANDSSIVVVFGAAQIDSFMQTCSPGDSVWIKRGKEIKAGKNGRVTEYRTAVKKA